MVTDADVLPPSSAEPPVEAPATKKKKKKKAAAAAAGEEASAAPAPSVSFESGAHTDGAEVQDRSEPAVEQVRHSWHSAFLRRNLDPR